MAATPGLLEGIETMAGFARDYGFVQFVTAAGVGMRRISLHFGIQHYRKLLRFKAGTPIAMLFVN